MCALALLELNAMLWYYKTLCGCSYIVYNLHVSGLDVGHVCHYWDRKLWKNFLYLWARLGRSPYTCEGVEEDKSEECSMKFGRETCMHNVAGNRVALVVPG